MRLLDALLDPKTFSELEDASDEDWYAVDLVAGDTVRFSVPAEGQSPGLSVRAADGALLRDARSLVGSNSIDFTPDASGRYFVSVDAIPEAAYSFFRVGEYRLETTLFDDLPDAGDTFADAVTLREGETRVENIERAGVDWFTFEVGDLARREVYFDGVERAVATFIYPSGRSRSIGPAELAAPVPIDVFETGTVSVRLEGGSSRNTPDLDLYAVTLSRAENDGYLRPGETAALEAGTGELLRVELPAFRRQEVIVESAAGDAPPPTAFEVVTSDGRRLSLEYGAETSTGRWDVPDGASRFEITPIDPADLLAIRVAEDSGVPDGARYTLRMREIGGDLLSYAVTEIPEITGDQPEYADFTRNDYQIVTPVTTPDGVWRGGPSADLVFANNPTGGDLVVDAGGGDDVIVLGPQPALTALGGPGADTFVVFGNMPTGQTRLDLPDFEVGVDRIVNIVDADSIRYYGGLFVVEGLIEQVVVFNDPIFGEGAFTELPPIEEWRILELGIDAPPGTDIVASGSFFVSGGLGLPGFYPGWIGLPPDAQLASTAPTIVETDFDALAPTTSARANFSTGDDAIRVTGFLEDQQVDAGLGNDTILLQSVQTGLIRLGATDPEPVSRSAVFIPGFGPFPSSTLSYSSGGSSARIDSSADTVIVGPNSVGIYDFTEVGFQDRLVIQGFDDIRTIEDLSRTKIAASGEEGPGAEYYALTETLLIGAAFRPDQIYIAEANAVFDLGEAGIDPGDDAADAPGGAPGSEEQEGSAGPSEGDDRLTGTPGADDMSALGGDDTVKSLAGDDLVDLGPGDDIVLSGTGADTVLGGDGDDTIKTASGADSIEGGAGDDIILSGNDDDTIFGGDGNDTIKPGRGDDVMDGGAGDDILVAFRGDEVLIGGDGNDTLLGNLDDDTIIGGAGDDRLQGGPGRDVFVFDTPEWGHDRIVLDFLPQSDTLDFRGSGLALADLSITQVGDNVLIEAGDSSILVNSQRFGALDVADFTGDVLLFG